MTQNTHVEDQRLHLARRHRREACFEASGGDL
jgi:hypothetical protein